MRDAKNYLFICIQSFKLHIRFHYSVYLLTQREFELLWADFDLLVRERRHLHQVESLLDSLEASNPSKVTFCLTVKSLVLWIFVCFYVQFICFSVKYISFIWFFLPTYYRNKFISLFSFLLFLRFLIFSFFTLIKLNFDLNINRFSSFLYSQLSIKTPKIESVEAKAFAQVFCRYSMASVFLFVDYKNTMRKKQFLSCFTEINRKNEMEKFYCCCHSGTDKRSIFSH